MGQPGKTFPDAPSVNIGQAVVARHPPVVRATRRRSVCFFGHARLDMPPNPSHAFSPPESVRRLHSLPNPMWMATVVIEQRLHGIPVGCSSVLVRVQEPGAQLRQGFVQTVDILRQLHHPSLKVHIELVLVEDVEPEQSRQQAL